MILNIKIPTINITRNSSENISKTSLKSPTKVMTMIKADGFPFLRVYHFKD